ncbi:hypothetical protein DSM01_3279 [Leeuwenhoekiella palythoae]|uniref:Uncharacterized protein n=2 Tax=Leeuwenhoekiella TaxID=283735 RepID=A0ABY0CZ12_9FLAO|nr:hypothetical protein DSM01_3279 [Leeuwenhoekiella palythoae]RXG28473.1 hypothetical protein DSL99_2475 [Leeuwenhoekiella marinoflava]
MSVKLLFIVLTNLDGYFVHASNSAGNHGLC